VRRIEHFSNRVYNQFRFVVVDEVTAFGCDDLFSPGRAVHQVLLKFLANLLPLWG
jgi:hypothetical protein